MKKDKVVEKHVSSYNKYNTYKDMKTKGELERRRANFILSDQKAKIKNQVSRNKNLSVNKLIMARKESLSALEDERFKQY